jgi:hypothetical protein
MKIWQAILLTIIIMFFLFLLPERLVGLVSLLVVWGSAIWIYLDAEKLNTKQYKSNLGISPIELSILTLFIWLIIFPAYLNFRYRIKNKLVEIRK